MNLLIVESPTKSKTLTKFLGDDYVVEATYGHIKDLPKSKLSVDVDKNFAPDYQLVDKRKKEIKKIKAAAKKAKNIYIATDPDREGEAIAGHVAEIIGNKNTQRISFHEITKEAVEYAIKTPTKINTHLVDAQIARRVLDRLVGYKLSPVLWRKVRRGLSAGRVQSVTVRLIVEREEEIKAFKPDEYWEIFCDVKKDEQFAIQLAKEQITNKATADKVVADLKSAKYTVSNITKREVSKKPHAPFTTSTMTQAAASRFGWSAKSTMSSAQKLYEKGLITYHRTDSVNIAASAITSLRKHIETQYGKEYLPEKPNSYKTKSKSAQEAHEAIRPTDVSAQDDDKLYQLIWKRFVASQMTSSIYDATRIEVTADQKYLLRASGQVTKFDGWRKVIPPAKTEEQILPSVIKGDKLDLLKVNPIQKFTQPPPRYNEASLIKTLEELGIGRPSTYAPTIYVIQIRQYVEKKDRRFFATSVGMAVTTFLVKNFPKIMEYEFTANMEEDLDQIAAGKKDWTKIMKTFYTPFDKMVEKVIKKSERVKIETEKLGKKCPDCGKKEKGELVIRVGRFGKFISCSRFPDCKHTEKYLQKIGMKCPDCDKNSTKPVGDVIVKKTGKGRQFFGCSNYPDCKYASWKDPLKNKTKDEV